MEIQRGGKEGIKPSPTVYFVIQVYLPIMGFRQKNKKKNLDPTGTDWSFPKLTVRIEDDKFYVFITEKVQSLRD